MRLFFAITLPEEARERLARIQSLLRESVGREGVRWEDPAKFHITLRFLGSVEPERVEAVKEAGRDAASACAPFSLRLGAPGAFPKSGPARVLWVGAEAGLPEYARLAEYLEGRLIGHGFAGSSEAHASSRTGQQPRPHITIARAKTPRGSDAIRRALRENNLNKVDKEGVISVYNVVLFHSDLRPGDRSTLFWKPSRSPHLETVLIPPLLPRQPGKRRIKPFPRSQICIALRDAQRNSAGVRAGEE